MYYNNIIETAGNTPLVKLNLVASHIKATVLVKVEYFNPGQSIKDRIAIQMIEEAEKAGKLKPGGTIVEGTSGNTGMGLALVAAVKGYRCIFTVADKQSQEKIDILRAVGAEVIVCPTNVEPEDPRSYYSVAKRLSQEIPNAVYLNQYDNPGNTAAHLRTTGPEIWEQTEGKVTHFAAGMGTCGTICGVSSYLKSQNANIQTIGIDTYGSIFKKLHETGIIDEKEIYPYLTEGIGEDILPANCNMEVIDHIIKVSDKDAALMTRKLARLEGLFVGWSCGSAVHGALEYAQQHLNKDDLMVIILPDHGTRYLGKVYNDSWMSNHNFLDQETMLNAQQIIHRKQSPTKLITLQADQPLGEAIQIMREQVLSQIPVMENGEIIGSLHESRLLNILLDDPTLKQAPVRQAMSDPLPFVLPGTRIEVISKLINKENPAVLVKSEEGALDIITQYDLINVLAQ
ncbi:MAG: pyridoxal-phosphate dependent enzyme [Bacteroidetes bacterium]|nr:MAG: pyridoxal-phosphate dependent enzyme [Bacteroidota bacterium]